MLFPCVKMIWLSSSSSSDFSSASLLLLFFTMEATSDRERRSVATSRSFSAPSLIFSSFLISRRIASLISSRRLGSRLSGRLSASPYLWLSSYRTGCLIYSPWKHRRKEEIFDYFICLYWTWTSLWIYFHLHLRVWNEINFILIWFKYIIFMLWSFKLYLDKIDLLVKQAWWLSGDLLSMDG